MTETLTAEERRQLEYATTGRPRHDRAIAKALRIIDCLAAERAALLERAERAEARLVDWERVALSHSPTKEAAKLIAESAATALVERAERAEAEAKALSARAALVERAERAEYPPSSADINALPDPIRRWVHDLETQADPSGTVREAAVQRQNADALAVRVRELESERNDLVERAERAEAQLDDTVAQLHELSSMYHQTHGCHHSWVAKAQPVTPARSEAECMTVTEEPGGPHMPNPAEWERTEAEQGVLDACAAWTLKVLGSGGCRVTQYGDPLPVVQAELARRELRGQPAQLTKNRSGRFGEIWARVEQASADVKRTEAEQRVLETQQPDFQAIERTNVARRKGMPAAYVPLNTDQRLGYLIEECGEVLAAAGKSIRWGLDSWNPELPQAERETNRSWLYRELRDMKRAIEFLDENELAELARRGLK